MARPVSARVRRGSTTFIFITVLLDTLGVGLIIPVGPQLVASFLEGDLGRAAHVFGILFSVYSTMQFFFAPILGGLSDRFGRRGVILPSLLGAATSYVLSGLAPSLAWLFVGRVIAGATGASFSAANAYVADITPPHKRAAAFGLVGAAFGLGFILGPAVGGILGNQGLRIPYFVAAGLNFVNFLYGLFVLPESLPRESRRSFTFARANPFASLANLGRHPIVLGLTGTLTATYLAQMILQSVWTLTSEARFGWTPRSVGLSLMVVGLSTAIVQGALVRTIIARLGERRALLFGIAMSVAGQIGFGLATRGWVMYAMILPFCLGGLAGPATQALITSEVGPTEQGEVQGSLNSLAGVMAVIGPLLGTALFARFGAGAATPHVPGAPFLAAASFLVVGWVLAARLFARTAARAPLPP
jgi:DHA1 family tetracycline resistance protein-like MFS transporter